MNPQEELAFSTAQAVLKMAGLTADDLYRHVTMSGGSSAPRRQLASRSRLTAADIVTAFEKLSQGEKDKVRDAIAAESDLMTIKEVCACLRMNPRTFNKHLKEGPPPSARGFDVRMIKEHRIGHRRYWLRSSVEAFIDAKE